MKKIKKIEEVHEEHEDIVNAEDLFDSLDDEILDED